MNHQRRHFSVTHSVVLSLLLALGSPQHALSSDPPMAKVVVKVGGFRNNNGNAQVRIWSSKDGFPSNDAKAFRKATVDIVNGTATATFADVPPGVYAVSSYHDENGNGKFDTRFPGIPTEGYAISNDVRGKLGPPPFGPARVNISEPSTEIVLTMHY